MPARKDLDAKALEVLGAARLAELLMEIGAGDAGVRRRLRLALAGARGPTEVAREVRKRLATIGRSQAFVDWRARRALADDLETQRRAIVEQVAPADAATAHELMWLFFELADGVLGRSDDSSGVLGAIFRTAVTHLSTLAAAARPDSEMLAKRVLAALKEDAYGQCDRLIECLAPALGRRGLAHLKRELTPLLDAPPEGSDRHAHIIAEIGRHSIRRALQAIADAEGDVDGFIDWIDAGTRRVPRIAAEIARRLLAACRAEEALEALERADKRGWSDSAWEDARIAALEALGRSEDAQAARWSVFERSLSASHLRDLLKRLPEFDAVDAESRALKYAAGVKSVLQAVSFLTSWPAHEQAAAVIERRAAELDGDQWEILPRIAETLAGRYPLAATLVLRALVEFTLKNSRSSRYRHAVRDLLDCGSLARAVGDFGRFEPHEAWLARLRREHGFKRSFWAMVDTS
jgi:hypothetical protein